MLMYPKGMYSKCMLRHCAFNCRVRYVLCLQVTENRQGDVHAQQCTCSLHSTASAVYALSCTCCYTLIDICQCQRHLNCVTLSTEVQSCPLTLRYPVSSIAPQHDHCQRCTGYAWLQEHKSMASPLSLDASATSATEDRESPASPVSAHVSVMWVGMVQAKQTRAASKPVRQAWHSAVAIWKQPSCKACNRSASCAPQHSA